MIVAVAALTLLVGVGIGFAVRRFMAVSRIQGAEARAQRVVLEAEREALLRPLEARPDPCEEPGALRLRHAELSRVP